MGNLRPVLDSDWDAWPGLRDFLPEPRDPQGWPIPPPVTDDADETDTDTPTQEEAPET